MYTWALLKYTWRNRLLFNFSSHNCYRNLQHGGYLNSTLFEAKLHITHQLNQHQHNLDHNTNNWTTWNLHFNRPTSTRTWKALENISLGSLENIFLSAKHSFLNNVSSLATGSTKPPHWDKSFCPFLARSWLKKFPKSLLGSESLLGLFRLS